MLNLVLCQIYSNTQNLVSIAFSLILPKLYAVSMMYTLNARQSMRAMRVTSPTDLADMAWAAVSSFIFMEDFWCIDAG